ncbi:tetratricopeptide repeat protein [Legionella drozanskii]|uniref:Tetratricopeptide repeat protein n=1 Tax=Legionella drozanskii LLAP-1 TaxID=1212489 RepID=A0A0W0SNG6_9GAMM|nr:tetratricopeptide repeat protein [Legionella drozanskii]KTC84749.1 Tetratricopeptide repeat protein [Legionella drozanskii LLAP-1]
MLVKKKNEKFKKEFPKDFNRIVEFYLNLKYPGKKESESAAKYQFGHFFYDEETLKKLVSEKNNLVKSCFSYLLSVLQNEWPQSLEKELGDKNLPNDFIRILVPELKKLKVAEGRLVLSVPNPSNINYRQIVNYDGFEPSEKEAGQALARPNDPPLFPETSYKALDQATPIDLKDLVNRLYSKYVDIGRFEDDPRLHIPIKELDALFESRNSYWLMELVKSLTLMQDLQMAYILGNLDEYASKLEGGKAHPGCETIINRTYPDFINCFKAHKKNFYVLQSVIRGMHSRFDLNTIMEPNLFDEMIRDVHRAYKAYLFDFERYINDLWASAPSKGKDNISDYLSVLIDQMLLINLHEITQGPRTCASLKSILHQREEDFESNVFAIITEGRDLKTLRLNLVRQNGDSNYPLFLRLTKLVSNGYQGILKLKQKITGIDQSSLAALPSRSNKTAEKKPSVLREKKEKQKKLSKASNNQQKSKQSNHGSKGSTKGNSRKGRQSKETNLPLSSWVATEKDQTEQWAISQSKNRPTEAKELKSYAQRKMKAGKFAEAIECFQQLIERYDQQTTCDQQTYFLALFELASCYEQSGQYEKALKLLISFPAEWKRNYPYMLTLGQVYMALGDGQKAGSVFHSMSIVWKDNNLVLQAVAKCHQMMREYAIALSLFRWLYDHNPNLLNTLDLACCYAKIGKSKQGLMLLDNLDKKVQDSSLVLAARVYCYNKAEKYQQVLDLLNAYAKTTDVKKDKNYFVKYVSCLINMDKFNEAAAMLARIPGADWKNDKKVAQLKSKYHQAKKEYSVAINELEKLDAIWPNDFQTLYALCVCYRKTNQPKLAIQSAERLIQCFPYSIHGHLHLIFAKIMIPQYGREAILSEYQQLKESYQFRDCLDLYYCECMYLLQQKNPNSYDLSLAEEKIRLAIGKFPHEQKLYVLLIDVLLKQGFLEEVSTELKKALDQFPDNASLYEKKIKYLKMSGQTTEARALKDDSLRLFDGNPKFANLFKAALNRTKVLVEMEPEKAVVRPKLVEKMRVKLPPTVLKAFQELKKIPGNHFLTNHFLTGSTAFKLVKAHLTDKEVDESQLSDLDFTSDAQPEELSKIAELRQHKHRKNVYSLRGGVGHRATSVDLEIHKDASSPNQEAWMLSNAKKRHFKVAALLIEEDDGYGVVHEMLEGTIDDIEKDILDTACYYPPILFEFDPTCVLGAIKYLTVYGFKPTEIVHQALLEWNPTNLKAHYPHLLALLIDYFESNPTTVLPYLRNLHEYGILAKIFNNEFQQPLVVLQEYDPDNLRDDFLIRFKMALEREYQSVCSIGFNTMPGEVPIDVDDLEPIVEDCVQEEFTSEPADLTRRPSLCAFFQPAPAKSVDSPTRSNILG